MSLDIYEFYQRCLVPLTPPASVSRIMEVLMKGGETTDDFAQVLSKDTELQYWVRLTVQRLGFEKRAAKLEQMITLLGQNRIRDLLIGRSIERRFLKDEDTLRTKLQAQMSKGAKDPAKGDEPQAVNEAETIPALVDFKVYLERANRAEEVAVSIRNSYPGQAFAGGVLYDYVRYFLKSLDFSKLSDARLKKVEVYLEEIFQDGLRCGVAANEIIQKISIPHQKNVFVTALVHNVGKALLLAYDPVKFEAAFKASTGAEKGMARLESTDAELEAFDLDHAQAGSLYLGRISYLAEIERSVDYHHNPHLLRFSNPNLYALACVLRVSGALSKLYQNSRKINPNTDHIKDQRLQASEDYAFLKLDAADWTDIKSNYALKLMKVGL